MRSLLLPNHLRPLALIALLLVVGGACSLGRPPVPIDRSQDDRIRTEVAARIAAEPALEPGSIRVEVDGRVVMLHGSVAGIAAWQCAITNAELVDGVQSVVDYLVIERGEREVRCLAPRPDSSLIVGGS